MRVSRRLTTVMVIAMSLVQALPVRGSGTDSGPCRDQLPLVRELAARTGPVAVEGQLLDRKGTPSMGSVQAMAWPSEAVLSQLKVGETVETIPVAAAATGADGRFALPLARESLPSEYISAQRGASSTSSRRKDCNSRSALVHSSESGSEPSTSAARWSSTRRCRDGLAATEPASRSPRQSR